mgnify:CR=1 FL=1
MDYCNGHAETLPQGGASHKHVSTPMPPPPPTHRPQLSPSRDPGIAGQTAPALESPCGCSAHCLRSPPPAPRSSASANHAPRIRQTHRQPHTPVRTPSNTHAGMLCCPFACTPTPGTPTSTRPLHAHQLRKRRHGRQRGAGGVGHPRARARLLEALELVCELESTRKAKRKDSVCNAVKLVCACTCMCLGWGVGGREVGMARHRMHTT